MTNESVTSQGNKRSCTVHIYEGYQIYTKQLQSLYSFYSGGKELKHGKIWKKHQTSTLQSNYLILYVMYVRCTSLKCSFVSISFSSVFPVSHGLGARLPGGRPPLMARMLEIIFNRAISSRQPAQSKLTLGKTQVKVRRDLLSV